MKKYLVIISLLFIKSAAAQIVYPDRQLPTDTPRLFAEGIFSDGLNKRDFTIAAKGDELFFTLQQARFVSSTILYMTKHNSKWSDPQVAPFSGHYRDLEASFSPDGQTIYFSSDRPLKAGVAKKDFDIWKVNRLPNGKWGEPEYLGPVVNSVKNEFYPSVTNSGNLYFTVEADYGKGKEDIVMCVNTASGYNPPVSLPEAINSPGYEFNAFVDADEQYILFTTYGREGNLGGGDLYISYKDKAGSWQAAKHLPAGINSDGLDYCPFITPDKQYLIFTSNRVNKQLSDGKPKTYSELQKLLGSWGNGTDDIYWVRFNKGW